MPVPIRGSRSVHYKNTAQNTTPDDAVRASHLVCLPAVFNQTAWALAVPQENKQVGMVPRKGALEPTCVPTVDRQTDRQKLVSLASGLR